MRGRDIEQPDRASYDVQWARLHQGIDPGDRRVVSWWVRSTAVAARPLARRGVSATAVTVVAVALAGAAVASAGDSRLRCAVTAVLVAASGALDGLDGAVAILRGRVTAWGAVADSVADRLADGLLLVALWRTGAAAGVAIAAGAALVLLEYTRARASAVSRDDLAAVTVGERPTRVIVTVMTFVTALVVGHGDDVALAGTAAVLAVSVAGLVHLLVTVRSGAADHRGDQRRGHRDERDAAAGMRRPADEEQPRDR